MACAMIADIIPETLCVVAGTPNYMDPRLHYTHHKDVTPAFLKQCDRFSLGMMGFKMLLHKFPYQYRAAPGARITTETVFRANGELNQ
jgi:serine/threonine protein kinase